MRTRITALVLLVSLLGGSTMVGAASAAPTITPVVTAAAEATPTSSPVYRFWSPKNQTHFFTINAGERDSIIASYPDAVWRFEGERYQAFTTQVAGTVPLYRFWSPRLSGHFFTTNESEKNSVINDYDDFTWTYEGVAYYVYPLDTAVANTTVVARFWSPTNQHHFYTASAEEAAVVKTYPRAIWTYEGDNYRVPTTVNPAPPVTVPSTPQNPGDSVNCGDFANWTAANNWFRTYYPYYGDIAGLDVDGDLVPCETLAGAPR